MPPDIPVLSLANAKKNILSSYLAHVDRKVYGNMQVLNDMKKLRILRAFLVQQTTWSRFNED